MTEDPDSHGESLEEIATFLSGVEAFKTLSPDQLSRVAAAVTHRSVSAGETMIVEGGLPGTQLFVLRDGTLDLLRRDSLVTVMTAGELLGYPSLLTHTAPAFTVRARSDCALYCIPGDLGIELLSREDGVRWLATTQRDALLYAARSLSPLPEVQTLPVSAVVRGTTQLCDPDTTISQAAATMIAESRSAILVRTREGLGIVTDVDLREKVVAGGVSRDAPVSAIMTSPVHTIGCRHARRGSQHRHVDLRREPPAGARRAGQRGRHGIGRRPDEPRSAQSFRAAPRAAGGARRRRARRGGKRHSQAVSRPSGRPPRRAGALPGAHGAPRLPDRASARAGLRSPRRAAGGLRLARLRQRRAQRAHPGLRPGQRPGLRRHRRPRRRRVLPSRGRGRQRRPHPLRHRARLALRPGQHRVLAQNRSQAGRTSSRTVWRARISNGWCAPACASTTARRPVSST